MKRIAMLFLCAARSACATTDSPQFSKDGCTVDLKKVCQYVFDRGGVASTQDGLQLNRERLENISVPCRGAGPI